jgi:hypothetical protein
MYTTYGRKDTAENSLDKIPQASVSFAWLSLTMSFVLVLIVLSFKSYFLFVPFTGGYLAILQFLMQVGMVLLIVAPPVLLRNRADLSNAWRAWFIVSTTMWTVTTLAIKLATFISFGEVWYQYAITYPIFLFLDWILPGIYLWMFFKLVRAPKVDTETT